ncbi:MAG: hypothetical protein IK093_13900 [Ruminiclostridium sp.]|nr:hypothetical protein [Ruminiclostridium sp.]
MSLELNTDDEFMSLCIPVSESTLNELRRSLLQAGCQEPIITWHGYILDGHKRYEICRNENIEYNVTEDDFETRENAIIKVCQKRVTDVYQFTPIYRFLVGKWFICLKNITALAQKDSNGKKIQLFDETGNKISAREQAANEIKRELNISSSSVNKFGFFAVVMDKIRNIDPVTFDDIMTGKIFIPYQQLIKYTDDDKELYRYCCNYTEHDTSGLKAASIHQKHDNNLDSNTLSMGVKNMPISDPDRELRGLTFTVPMWISSISRAMEHTDTDKATDTAKSQLSDALIKLIVQINITLEELQ